MEHYRKIDSLTGLRAFAALWVVLHNMSIYPGVDPGFVQQLDWGIAVHSIDFGFQGVDIFFFLSGFVMAYVYQHEFMHTLDRQRIIRYYWLRLGRIYPLHFMILCLIIILTLHEVFPFRQNIQAEHAFLNFTLMDAWGIHTKSSWNYAAWSLSAEWFAYLLFPFLTFMIIRDRSIKGYTLLLGMLIATYAILMADCCNTVDVDDGLGGLIRVTFGLMSGCILYNYFRLGVGKSLPWDIIGIMGFISLFMVHDYFYLNTNLVNTLSYINIAVILYALTHAKSLLAWCFSNKVSVYLGEISYAIFLLHAPYMMLWAHITEHKMEGGFTLLALLMVGLLLCSSLCYHMIEKPCRNYVKQKINRKVE